MSEYKRGDPKPIGVHDDTTNDRDCSYCRELDAWRLAQRQEPEPSWDTVGDLDPRNGSGGGGGTGWRQDYPGSGGGADPRPIAKPADWDASNNTIEYFGGTGASADGRLTDPYAGIAEAVFATTGQNPKDRFGKMKVSISKIPFLALLWCAKAMMRGAIKYGEYNWRDKQVIASVYIDACFRHLGSWFEGEELSSDDKCHHLGHVMACCAILIDAQARGNLSDDRPKGDKGAVPKLLTELTETGPKA